MPLGPEPLGLVYFAGVKLIGYSAFGHHLRKKFETPGPSSITFGVARTALGLLVGACFASLMFFSELPPSGVAFYLLLLPIRLGEWLFTIWFFFSRKIDIPQQKIMKSAVLGSVVSYLLDIPAITSVFVIPGGAWIC